MPTYIFKVIYKNNPAVWREVELLPEHTLDDLHTIIWNIFGFGKEKLYSFFMGNTLWDEGSEYCSPLFDEGAFADEVKIPDLALQLGQKFLYLFDYDHCFEFEIEFTETAEIEEEETEYPRLLAEEGIPPPEFIKIIDE
jgi:hypothetical protein